MARLVAASFVVGWPRSTPVGDTIRRETMLQSNESKGKQVLPLTQSPASSNNYSALETGEADRLSSTKILILCSEPLFRA